MTGFFCQLGSFLKCVVEWHYVSQVTILNLAELLECWLNSKGQITSNCTGFLSSLSRGTKWRQACGFTSASTELMTDKAPLWSFALYGQMILKDHFLWNCSLYSTPHWWGVAPLEEEICIWRHGDEIQPSFFFFFLNHCLKHAGDISLNWLAKKWKSIILSHLTGRDVRFSWLNINYPVLGCSISSALGSIW